ncbi:flavodoxin [Ruminococcus sp.]|uniref:flavodoxin n=1 Tax=Ruminococcus sp. TaxID=41978 RepID=UPI0025F60B60|nr:flavodoxin [Ruminococcus sp.]MBQ9543059.1 flavodoxin [Ruminococcus sp.]
MKHTMKIMIPFLIIAGLLTGCGSQGTTGSKAETTQATEAVTTAAVTEKETQAETEQTQEAADAVTEAPEETTDETADSNILVVYYSAQEHTKGVAEIVSDELGADIFVIEPVDIYTEDDLNWRDEQSRVVTEHNDENHHTELVSTTVENWDSYDTVLIGYPLWWREASWVVNDFVTDNDFSGKDVIPFCTSMSDGIGESGVHLAEMAGTGNWLEGMRFSENYDTAEVVE